MEHLTKMLELVAERFTQFANSNVVVGEPIQLDGVTIVTLSRISVGFGAGGGEGEGDHHHRVKDKSHKGKRHGAGKGIGGGAGAGGKVRPVGVIVFDEQGVQVQPIPTKKGLLDKIFDKVPDVIDLIQQATEGKQQAETEK